MRITGKQSTKQAKPQPNPSTITDAPGVSPKDQEHGEGSYSGTRDYQEGVKSYLRTADARRCSRRRCRSKRHGSGRRNGAQGWHQKEAAG